MKLRIRNLVVMRGGSSPHDMQAGYGHAAAAGLGEAFHLIGHDHGACLGWKVAGEGKRGSQRILSYTALSIPHIDAFSAGLVGPDADRAQQAHRTRRFSVALWPPVSNRRHLPPA